MPKYTILAQYTFADSMKWGGPIDAPEEIEDERSPQEILESRDWTDTALLVVGFPSGVLWRVAIWEGHGVDVRAAEPAFVLGAWKAAVDGEGCFPIPEDALLAELQKITAQRVRSDREREAIIAGLMRTKTQRSRIAEAAGIKEARLYQIRDRKRPSADDEPQHGVRKGDWFISGENTKETMALPCEVIRVDDDGAWAELIFYTPLTEFWKRMPLPLPEYFRALPE